MANFNYLDFIKIPTATDRILSIKDKNNIIVYKLNPFMVDNVLVQNNNIRVNFTNSDYVLIDFNNNAESRIAIKTLESNLEILRNKVPYNIDKQTELYVNQLIGSISTVNNDLTVFGDIIPGTNSVYNLGSSLYQWQSLFTDNISFTGDILLNGTTSVLSYFSATSSTALQIPDIGQSVFLSVPPKMSWTPMQSLLVYSNLVDNYMVDDYVEGDSSAYFIGNVDSYDRITGTLSLIVDYSNGFGITISGTSSNIVPTYSLWYINITGKSGELNPNYLIDNDYKFEFLEGGITTYKNNIATGSVINNTILRGTTYLQQTVEDLGIATYSYGLSPSTITYDFSQSSIWYQDSLTENYVASFINVPEEKNTVITNTILISQSSTAYIPNIVAINSITYSVNWSNGIEPSGNINQIDLVGFSFIKNNNNLIVLGQLSTYTTI
jgi:hypothetical protein